MATTNDIDQGAPQHSPCLYCGGTTNQTRNGEQVHCNECGNSFTLGEIVHASLAPPAEVASGAATSPSASTTGLHCPECFALAGQQHAAGCSQAGLASAVRKAIEMLAAANVNAPLAVPGALGVLRSALEEELQRRQNAADRARDEWFDPTSPPDDDLVVLLELSDDEVWPGFRDSGIWRYVTSEPVESVQVTGWMHMPAGRGSQVHPESAIQSRATAASASIGAAALSSVPQADDRANWNAKQWYEHVGAWETPEGFISFGSVMAVRAMLIQFGRAQVAAHPAPSAAPAQAKPRFDEQIFRTMVATWAHSFKGAPDDIKLAERKEKYWRSIMEYVVAAPAQVAQGEPACEWSMMCGDWRDELVAIHGPHGHIASGLTVEQARAIIDAHAAPVAPSQPQQAAERAVVPDTHEGRCAFVRHFGGPAMVHAVTTGKLPLATAVSLVAAALTVQQAGAQEGEQSAAARDVLAERRRQVDYYDPEHDDAHPNGEIAAYGAFYAMPPASRDWPATETGYGETFGEAIVPADWKVPKTGDRRRELVKAGALILAEIERIDRAAHQDSAHAPTDGAAS